MYSTIFETLQNNDFSSQTDEQIKIYISNSLEQKRMSSFNLSIEAVEEEKDPID